MLIQLKGGDFAKLNDTTSIPRETGNTQQIFVASTPPDWRCLNLLTCDVCSSDLFIFYIPHAMLG